jgi:hypothetical protein
MNERVTHAFPGRQQGDPKELLRSINPREASLVDAASGLHVRLRLGGSTFPPLIFYKIFTHRPVTDICAFCPRNYAKELYKPPAGQQAAAKTEVAQPEAHSSPARDKDPFVLDEKLRCAADPAHACIGSDLSLQSRHSVTSHVMHGPEPVDAM